MVTKTKTKRVRVFYEGVQKRTSKISGFFFGGQIVFPDRIFQGVKKQTKTYNGDILQQTDVLNDWQPTNQLLGTRTCNGKKNFNPTRYIYLFDR